MPRLRASASDELGKAASSSEQPRGAHEDRRRRRKPRQALVYRSGPAVTTMSLATATSQATATKTTASSIPPLTATPTLEDTPTAVITTLHIAEITITLPPTVMPSPTTPRPTTMLLLTATSHTLTAAATVDAAAALLEPSSGRPAAHCLVARLREAAGPIARAERPAPFLALRPARC